MAVPSSVPASSRPAASQACRAASRAPTSQSEVASLWVSRAARRRGAGSSRPSSAARAASSRVVARAESVEVKASHTSVDDAPSTSVVGGLGRRRRRRWRVRRRGRRRTAGGSAAPTTCRMRSPRAGRHALSAGSSCAVRRQRSAAGTRSAGRLVRRPKGRRRVTTGRSGGIPFQFRREAAAESGRTGLAARLLLGCEASAARPRVPGARGGGVGSCTDGWSWAWWPAWAPQCGARAACPSVRCTPWHTPSRSVRFCAPHPDGPIWGAVDPAILGECSADAHDVHVVAGGDGYRYRTWHPQVDPTGCVYAHEHGDDPARMTNAEIAAAPVRFGYIGRRHPMAGEPAGHEEAHEGFKVFIASPATSTTSGASTACSRARCSTWAPAGRGGSRCRTTRPRSA